MGQNMNNSFLFECAVKLCSADHVSGYISANPVIDSRLKLTEKRLTLLYKLVSEISSKLISQSSADDIQRVTYCFKSAIDLTSADIACGVIAVEPILYERDAKIPEVIETYYDMVSGIVGNLSINCDEVEKIKSSHDASSEYNKHENNDNVEVKTVIIPVYQKMKKSKIKKGKR